MNEKPNPKLVKIADLTDDKQEVCRILREYHNKIIELTKDYDISENGIYLACLAVIYFIIQHRYRMNDLDEYDLDLHEVINAMTLQSATELISAYKDGLLKFEKKESSKDDHSKL